MNALLGSIQILAASIPQQLKNSGAESTTNWTPVIASIVLGLFLLISVAWLFSRYRMCPPDRILVVFGKLGAGQPSRCYHGGSTFVLPVIQSYGYLDLNPINIDVPLRGALSSQNIRVDVPSSFIVGISTDPILMQNAAARLLGRTRDQIRDLAAEIIMGQMRVVIASMTIEEINSDREKLIRGITDGVDTELHKVGLHLINANITDIQDGSGYIEALGREAAARAINDAEIKVAEETRKGEIGKAQAQREQAIAVAAAQAEAIQGQNTAQERIAESNAHLAVKKAEAKKDAEVAEAIQEAKTREEAYVAERIAEIKRAELMTARQEADIITAAKVEKTRKEVEAQAAASVMTTEQQGKADSLLIQKQAEARAITTIAQGESEALLLKKKAEGEGLQLVGEGEAAAIQAILAGKAEGFRQIVSAAGHPSFANSLLVTEQLTKIVDIQANAIKGLRFDKVVVMGNGKEGAGVGNFVSDLFKGVLPLNEVGSSVGYQLPKYLGETTPDPIPQATQTPAPQATLPPILETLPSHRDSPAVPQTQTPSSPEPKPQPQPAKLTQPEIKPLQHTPPTPRQDLPPDLPPTSSWNRR